MGFHDEKSHYRTITCDGPGCDKTVRFEITDVKAIQEIEWLKGLRVVHSGDNRQLAYCSDVCEVKGVTTGEHNLKEKPTAPTVVPATEGDVKAAAAQAQGEARTIEALKTGEGEAKIII